MHNIVNFTTHSLTDTIWPKLKPEIKNKGLQTKINCKRNIAFWMHYHLALDVARTGQSINITFYILSYALLIQIFTYNYILFTLSSLDAPRWRRASHSQTKTAIILEITFHPVTPLTRSPVSFCIRSIRYVVRIRATAVRLTG